MGMKKGKLYFNFDNWEFQSLYSEAQLLSIEKQGKEISKALNTKSYYHHNHQHNDRNLNFNTSNSYHWLTLYKY